MIIDSAVYRNGERRSVPDVHDLAGALEDGGFAWIGVADPDHHEVRAIADHLGLHELLVEDILKAHQRAKLERHGDVDLAVFKTAAYTAPDTIEIGEVQVVLGARFVLTVRHGHAPPLASVRARIDADPELAGHGPAAVLYAVADHLVDDYGPVVDELEIDVDEAEALVFGEARTNPTARIYRLKRQVMELLRNLMPIGDVLSRLEGRDATVAADDLTAYFRDVADHLRRVLSRAELVRDLLTDALNANLAQVAVRQNDDMRTISGWAALIAAPTLLAGVWGMNFTHMPELAWYLGYPVALGLMVLVVVVLYRRFRRVGWL